MNIVVKGKQLDVGEALRQRVSERLNAGIKKYFDHALDAQVVFSRDAHRFTTAITVRAAAGIAVTSHAASDDVHACFDQAADRIEKQLRRYKRRLVDHHKKAPQRRPEEQPARQYTLATETHEDEADEPASLEPVIVAEQPASIGTYSVGEAVMHLNLADLPVLLFRNSAHGQLNVVFRRSDGNIGWIDPERMS